LVFKYGLKLKEYTTPPKKSQQILIISTKSLVKIIN